MGRTLYFSAINVHSANHRHNIQKNTKVREKHNNIKPNPDTYNKGSATREYEKPNLDHLLETTQNRMDLK